MTIWLEIGILLLSLGLILVSAGFFTNGVEWLGKKMNLTVGAVGSILAAVGTAMPETIIPLIAILFSHGEVGHEIGIGAILGAPFTLGTLALFLSGGSVLVFQKVRQENYPRIEPEPLVIQRDLTFFLPLYTLAVLATFFSWPLKIAVAVVLIMAYLFFVYHTITCGEKCTDEKVEIDPLLIVRKATNPPLFLVLLQIGMALAGIIIGAKFFIDGIKTLSALWGIPALIFSLLIAPLATEMPEKFNSIIWLGQRKDTMALGNITGAMVFQGSIIPAVGILLTSWVLSEAALLSAILAIVSALFTLTVIRYRGFLDARHLLTYGGVFYLVFLLAALTGTIS
ncbi:MAG: sodium:calcium antiporter [Peptococcaceae bacterium]